MLKKPVMTRGLRMAAAATLAATSVAVAVPTLSADASTAGTTMSHTIATTSQGTMTSRVFGTFGRQGVVRGTFVPTRSFVAHGVTKVQGELAVTLRRANGTLVGRATRHDATLPVNSSQARTSAVSAAARATCNILHLVLGPLDLNLLGLHVHLNRVVLDITAESGSGNLLGNLLCAVAHLLDGTGVPTLTDLLNLSNLLNRLIGGLT